MADEKVVSRQVSIKLTACCAHDQRRVKDDLRLVSDGNVDDVVMEVQNRCIFPDSQLDSRDGR